jgi:hypothetical protein
METELFKETITLANYRESIVASSLARHWRMCLNLTPFEKTRNFRSSFDYLLFDPLGDKPSVKIEQQDSFQIRKEVEDSFCIELTTYNKGKALDGKLHYCKADVFCIVAPYIEKIYLIKFKRLKDYIFYLQEADTLNIFDSSASIDQWKKKHDTNPVRLCYLDITQSLYDLKDDVSVYTFKDLGILQDLPKAI